MSYNRFYSNYQGGNVTFHDFRYPPPVYPMPVTKEISDEEFIKNFKSLIPQAPTRQKLSATKIYQIKEELKSLVSLYNEIQEEEKKLSERITEMTDNEWDSAFNSIINKKNEIKSHITALYSSQLDLGKKLIAKRLTKRLRLKRLKKERQKEKEELKKELAEKSRKIDENLQKIQDDIQRAKQAEEDKLQADAVLQETLRKKLDARRSIMKLEALVKLRQARLNTAKGMGKTVSEAETTQFLDNIDKLRKLWEYKAIIYQKEEKDLRDKLEQNFKQNVNVCKSDVVDNIMKWKVTMFGDDVQPQVDYNGNVEWFIAVRRSWDRYIDNGPDATPIPLGWLTPQ
ncbi:unnamed protein product [Danaus chrysippus]|uniref:(African queen) hypothetical protein n=1 Tax=Danaus chrysippus TaxID=151541 RepID=A0A8J2VV11_9NEOP|nr:unnamed protein product [Danaus chrysippus]